MAPHEVCVLTERLQSALGEPLTLQGREIYASASIGIVLGNAEYKSVDDLLRDADTAMYRAKGAGRGGYELFDPAMHASAMTRLTLETELRRAVERKEFIVYYQPIVELASSEICGFEALVRWARPDGRIAEPSEFIAVAEDTGLIVPLTYFVMKEASQQVAVWQSMFGRPWSVSVNISSKLFSRMDFTEEVEQAMLASGLVDGSLKLEITESVLLTHSDIVELNFDRLKKINVAVHLDDFGTGYSSLGYLQRYPVDALKLDRSFVARMGTDGDECPIGNAIVKLARELGMGLIAEGVETPAHAEQLLALDCPHAQGYLFSHPLPAHMVVPLLSRTFGHAAVAVA
jgi:EAL domain-containing protein (putative c-di-GMP-specific phosphodiesterase class I)